MIYDPSTVTRDDLEDGWPLVLRHYDGVVQYLETRPTASKRKVSRRDVLQDCRDTRDIRVVGAKHHVSPSVISAILVRAIRVARAFDSGKPPRPQKPRRTLTMTVTAVPTTLIRDIDAWAAMRGRSRREAAIELWKAGLDVLSLRAERQAEAAARGRRARAKNSADRKT